MQQGNGSRMHPKLKRIEELLDEYGEEDTCVIQGARATCILWGTHKYGSWNLASKAELGKWIVEDQTLRFGVWRPTWPDVPDGFWFWFHVDQGTFYCYNI